jgi:glycine oxidase
MTERFDDAIVGAGVVGLATAGALAALGRRVLLLDRGKPGAEASAAAAGLLAPQIEAPAGDALLPLALAARDRHAILAHELAADGFDVGFHGAGIAHVAFDEATEALLQAQVDAQRAAGLDARWLDQAALRARHPGISAEARGALLAPRDGAVNNVALCAALLSRAYRLGVEVLHEEVCEITARGGRVTGVNGATSNHPANNVVLAAGAWAGTIAGAPRGVPVEPVRGQMAALPWPAREPGGVLFSGHGYLLRRGDEALVGSTMEHTGFELGTTAEGMAHLAKTASRLLPSLAGLPFVRSWSGLRPMTPDGLPIIGRDPDMDGLIYATGHGRNGILLGPLTGDIVAQLVVSGASPIDISMCSVTRFT